VWPCTSSSSSIFLPKTAFQLINYRNPPHYRRDSSSPVFSHLLLRCCLLVMRWTMGHLLVEKYTALLLYSECCLLARPGVNYIVLILTWAFNHFPSHLFFFFLCGRRV
jgi:hypothetical protein